MISVCFYILSLEYIINEGDENELLSYQAYGSDTTIRKSE